MARPKRECPGGVIYHVLNRAVARIPLFKREGDYEALERTLAEALQRVPIQLLAYCVMPNHWHFVVQPNADDDLSKFMQWFTLTHAQRWRVAHQTVGFGPLYQGRFKSFPIECDEHLLTVLRYVERNALRAGLVKRVEAWRWGSYHARSTPDALLHPLLREWPIEMPRNWRRVLNTPQTPAEEEAVQTSIRRGRPFGDPEWQERISKRMSLLSTLRPPGRPPLA
jgi:putative transposase